MLSRPGVVDVVPCSVAVQRLQPLMSLGNGIAVVQGPKMQQTNGGNNGRTRNAVQSTKQATTWLKCAKGAEPNFGPIFGGGGGLEGGWVGGVGAPCVTYSPSGVSLQGPGQSPVYSSPRDAVSIFS